MAAGLTEDEYRRLVLANQYEILSRLAPGEAEWSQALDRVVRGFPLGDAPNLTIIREYIKEPLTDQEVEMVHDILDLFLRVQHALAGAPDEADANFPGFDGNNESQALAYFRTLREADRWTHVRPEGDGGINSHHPTYEIYRRMIGRWNNQGRPNNLTPDQAREVLGTV